jgi:type II secretion system protein H
MKSTRQGFTMIEMLVVMMIMGIVLAFALPKFNSLRNSGRVGAAKVQLSTGLTTARAAAVQNGRPARWSIAGNVVTVAAQDAAGNYVNLRAPFNYNTEYNVSLRSTAAQIVFDGRGIATGLGGTVKLYVVGSTTDSICVTALGVVMRNGCL